MSVQDPIADMICRIKNAQARGKPSVAVPFSKHKKSIAEVIRKEGYIEDFSVEGEEKEKKNLVMILKYYRKKPVIEMIRRESKSSRRVYCKHDELPTVRSGMGVAVISTSRGVMTDAQARKESLGGEVLFLLA